MMRKKNIKKSLLSILNFPSLQKEETKIFKDLGHDQLLDMFERWILIEFATHYQCSTSNFHGWHDKGIDSLITITNREKARVAVQIKSYGDVKRGLDSPINNTLVHFKSFNVDLLMIIFCGDYTDKSQKDKIKQQISKIESLPDEDNIIIIDPLKAITLFNRLSPLKYFIDQLKKIEKVPSKICLNVTKIKKDPYESGFPILTLQSRLFRNDKEGFFVSLMKAYLITILGYVAPDYLEYRGEAPFKIMLDEKHTLSVPWWSFRGHEENGPVRTWGTSATKMVIL